MARTVQQRPRTGKESPQGITPRPPKDTTPDLFDEMITARTRTLPSFGTRPNTFWHTCEDDDKAGPMVCLACQDF